MADSTLGQIVGTTPEGRPIIKRFDGQGYSTELSVTVRHPKLNGGKWTNIPSIYGGKVYNQDQALNIILKNKGIDPDTGQRVMSFPNLGDAEAAARSRSKTLGKILENMGFK